MKKIISITITIALFFNTTFLYSYSDVNNKDTLRLHIGKDDTLDRFEDTYHELQEREIDAPFSAAEITGVYLDAQEEAIVAEIAGQLEAAMAIDDNRHILEILETVLPQVGEVSRQSIQALLTELQRDGAEFDYNNFAYQALVRVVRAWDKRHMHAHIGDSVHESFIWDEMVKFDGGRGIFDRVRLAIQESGIKPAEQIRVISQLEREVAVGRMWHELDVDFRFFILDIFQKCKIKPGLAEYYDIDSWKRTLMHVAMQHFSDGVTELNLIVRIDRGFASIEEIIQAGDEAFREAELLAEEIYGKKFKVTMTVSFPRHESQMSPESVDTVVSQVIELKRRGLEYADRVVGIDIAGAEFIINDDLNTIYRRNSDYRKVIEKAYAAGMITMMHLGDMGHTRKATSQDLPHRSSGEVKRMEILHIENRETTVREHLRFIEDGLRDSGPVTDINHGTILAPDGALITKGPYTGYSFAGQAIQDPANLAKVDELLDYVREEDMEIHTCPTANVNNQEIRLYRGHPFHAWIARGVRTSLNADDFYWGNVRKSLSDEIVKMMLTAPESTDGSYLTPRLAQEISRPKPTSEGAFPEALAHLQGALEWPVDRDGGEACIFNIVQFGHEIPERLRHFGIDIGIHPDTEVRTCQGGIVFDVVKYDDTDECHVMILSPEGIMWTYGHLRYSSLPPEIRDVMWSPDMDLSQAYRVGAGQVLGKIHHHTMSTHLHLGAYYHESLPQFASYREMDLFYDFREDWRQFVDELPDAPSRARLKNVLDPMLLLKPLTAQPARSSPAVVFDLLSNTEIDLTRIQIATALGLYETDIQPALDSLIESGVVVKEGDGLYAIFKLSPELQGSKTLISEIQEMLDYRARASRNQPYSSLKEVIAIPAQRVIRSKEYGIEDFREWVANQKNKAVVVIAMDKDEYEAIEGYEDIVHVRIVEREEDRAFIDELIAQKKKYRIIEEEYGSTIEGFFNIFEDRFPFAVDIEEALKLKLLDPAEIEALKNA